MDYLINKKVRRKITSANESSSVAGYLYSWKQFNNASFRDNRDRPETLTRILSSMPFVDKTKVLSVGPRFTNELFVLEKYGFDHSGILGLDTFSYSRRVIAGDMHEMPFPDHTFPNVICGWTLSYSRNPISAVAEIERVTRSNGYMAIAVQFVVEPKDSKSSLGNSPILGILSGQERIQTLNQFDSLFKKSDRVFGVEKIRNPFGTYHTFVVYRKI